MRGIKQSASQCVQKIASRNFDTFFAMGKIDSRNSCACFAPMDGELLSATRPVLANRHRSHHSGVHNTKEKHMIVGKFTRQDGGYTGRVPAFTGPSVPIRIAPTDQKGVDYLVALQQ